MLPSQSNVYGMCYFNLNTGQEKVLVACLNGDIVMFEYYLSDTGELKPSKDKRPMRLQYISGRVSEDKRPMRLAFAI